MYSVFESQFTYHTKTSKHYRNKPASACATDEVKIFIRKSKFAIILLILDLLHQLLKKESPRTPPPSRARIRGMCSNLEPPVISADPHHPVDPRNVEKHIMIQNGLLS